MQRFLITGLAFIGLLCAEKREVAVVMDTSSSMNGYDRPRYAVQVSKILADLMADGDGYTVARLAEGSLGGENCASPADRALETRLSGDRQAFKDRLDRASIYNIRFNHFAAAVHTARASFSSGPARRMFLFIADSGGLDNCEGSLSRELHELRRQGVFVAAINLGGSVGSFGSNPGIESAQLARNSMELVGAVARVYQRFLGAKNVQTGPVSGAVEVHVDPFVKEAFLVVASDGAIGTLEQAGSNPGADSVDLNFRGGGTTRGLDGRDRSYRLVRLDRPKAGAWRFRAPGLDGGYMLLQDFSLSARLVTSTVSVGKPSTLTWDVINDATGQRVTDSSFLDGLQLEVELGGSKKLLHHREGQFQLTHTFPGMGKQLVNARLMSRTLDRTATAEVNVTEPAHRLVQSGPVRGEAGRPLVIRVQVDSAGTGLRPPSKIVAELPEGGVVELLPEPRGWYVGKWTPNGSGVFSLRLSSPDASFETAEVPVEIVGKFEPGNVAAVRIGPVKSQSVKADRLDLSAAEVRGTVRGQLSTDWSRHRTAFEIQTPSGWRELGPVPMELLINERGPRTWQLRLRAGECPAACSFNEPHRLTLETPQLSGTALRTEISVQMEVKPDSFLVCWWWPITLLTGILLAAFAINGFVFPTRFPARAGLQLSPEEDLGEGFFANFRRQPGSRVGFYRSARLYLSEDFRLKGKPKGAFVRIRAGKAGIWVAPYGGAHVWRQRMDGEWETLPGDRDTPARPGMVFRNEGGTVYFEIRFN